MEYRAAVDYILQFADFERTSAARRESEAFALSRITSLLDRMGRPQDGRSTVHVAGSKGKGSTAAMVESILRAAGLTTGLFTSPHLDEFSERIRLDGRPLSDEAFGALVESMQPTIEAELAEHPGRLSTFEILTAMGYQAFQQAEVDVQVIEVGLGGRLDSTNVLRETAVAVVTALSWEHADILGDSLIKIAAEKAGIITAATSAAVLAPQRSSEAASTVRNYAAKMQVPIVDVDERYRWERAGVEHYEQTRGQWFRVWRTDADPKTDGGTLYLFPLLGVHQIENAVAALAAVDALRQQGLTIPPAAVHTGLATVVWPGRLETVSRDPWIVVDAAHNEESLERVLEALPQYFDYERLIVVLGVLGDKNVQAMTKHLHEAAAVIVTQPNHPRARDAALVAQAIRSGGAFTDDTLFVEPRVEDAVRAAVQQATPGDLICVLGSLFVAAEARGRIQREVGGEPTSARADR